MQRRTREDPEERGAWSACRWRAERTPREWRVAVVDDAIEARVRTGAYALLDEDRAAGWNDEAHRLCADVTDDLVRRTGAATRPLVDHYVQLAVLDWFLLPSSSAALAYLEVRAPCGATSASSAGDGPTGRPRRSSTSRPPRCPGPPPAYRASRSTSTSGGCWWRSSPRGPTGASPGGGAP
ncbi:hypothetical protein F1544_20710 [Kineosporiaceae bacterium B12]|nr:hypothetical protein [Kineococcus rubinsiae]